MTMMDEVEIRRLRERWAFARDYGEWDELARCFHPGATIDISWYRGDVAGFIEGSKKAIARLEPEERLKHWLGNARVWVSGDRGVAETDAIILVRVFIDDHLFDVSSRARFYDLVERRDGTWKIAQWKMVYDADRMDAVHPGSVPDSFYEAMDLSRYPDACAHLCFRLEKHGRDPVNNIATINSPEERVIKAEGARWLEGGQEAR